MSFLLSDSLTVRSLIEQRGDVHHVFPKDYLAKSGFKKSEYNQVANYVYTEQSVNIKLGNASPRTYMDIIYQDINLKKNGITALKIWRVWIKLTYPLHTKQY